MQRIELGEAKQNRFGESYFTEVNHLTFEKLSSDAVFKSHYSELFDSEDFLYIVIGTDSGLLYQYAKEQSKSRNLKFVFVDFKEVNDATGLLTSDTPEIWDQDGVSLVNDGFNFQKIGLYFNSYVIRRKLTLIKSLAVMDAKPGSPYYDLWERYEVTFNAFRRNEFNAQSTKVFEKERILNAADNLIPISRIAGSIKNQDAIILGGGPTLDDAIPWIKENQDKLVIFAAARIAKRLEKESIIADFFVTVDPYDWSFDNSKTVLSFSDESILLHSFHAQHKLVSQWNGVSLYGGSKFGFKLPGVAPNPDTSGPTVTNSALHLAYILGAKRIFLSGVDFCYAKGLTHESGSDEAKMSDTLGRSSKAKIEDNAGNMTETGDDFYSAMHSMQTAVQMYLSQRRGMEFFNLGLHSAKMKNVPYVQFENVILNGEDKTQWFSEIKSSLSLSMDERLALTDETLKDLSNQLKRFKKLHDLSKEGASVSEKLYDPVTHMPKPKHMERVKKLRKKVETLVGEDGDMIVNYQATFFSDTFKPIDNEQPMEKEDVVEQLIAFFSGIEKVSQHFVENLEQGVERAKLRLDEVKGILPSKLYDRWEKWNEFGRAVQWAGWHSDMELSDTERASLDQALEKFNLEYENQDHNYLSRVKKRVNNVAILLARANNAFNAKDYKELEAIIDHSEKLDAEDDIKKQSFLSLLKGMVEDVQGHYEKAVESYSLVQMPSLKQQALKKMLDLAMQYEDFQMALSCLEELCQFSLDYMIAYADLLGIMGSKDASIEILKMYLSQNADNLNAQNKLAQLYVDVGQKDLALSVAMFVLDKEPNDKTAQYIIKSIQPN